jgi:hypothetical protein
MGVFFESKPAQPKIRSAILESLRDNPASDDVAQNAATQRANEVTGEIQADREFKVGRFIGALILFGVIAAFAWYAEIQEMAGASEALWGIATTAFGIVLGFVGGEAASST